MSIFRYDKDFDRLRERMVKEQLVGRNITDTDVIEACSSVPRHLFVMPQDRSGSYEDYPLPIGFGQTISQPYMVAYMAQQLELQPADVVLEIGTGSGYAAAIMAQLAAKVFTLEIVKELYDRTSKLMKKLDYKNIICYLRDGYEGLSDEAPFDKIVLTAAPNAVPQILFDQLKVGGRLIAPIGNIRLMQRLVQYDKLGEGKIKESELMGVSFVEMLRSQE